MDSQQQINNTFLSKHDVSSQITSSQSSDSIGLIFEYSSKSTNTIIPSSANSNKQFTPLQLKSSRQSLKGFNASYLEGLEGSNSIGGGGGGVADRGEERGGDGGGRGGGGVEIMRVFLRWVEFLLGSDLENGGMVALPAKVALLCAQAIQQLHLVFMEIGNAFVQYTFVGALLIAAAITFVFLHYF